MVLTPSKMIPLGTKAPAFSLPATNDKMYSLDCFSYAQVLVIIFMCNHCPYVQGIWDRLVQLQTEFQKKGVQLVGINANNADDYPEDSPEKMQEYYKKYNMNFPYLRDETQEAAKAYQAACTPDIFVFDQNRKLAYRGRIDDSPNNPEKVTKHELAEALEKILDGKEIQAEEQNPSVGCSIKWKS